MALSKWNKLRREMDRRDKGERSDCTKFLRDGATSRKKGHLYRQRNPKGMETCMGAKKVSEEAVSVSGVTV